MRLNYFGLGDVVKEDEINALLTIFFSNENVIKDKIMLDEDGYKTNFANYIATFDENSIDYTYENIIIKDGSGLIKIDCISELNCIFYINFNDKIYSSQNGTIAIPLQDFSDEIEEDVPLIIKNSFNININYLTPFIKDIKGDDHIINTTQELADIIESSKNGETIILKGNITHNRTTPIEIDKYIIINGGNFIDNNTKSRIFNISNIGRLEIYNSTFNNINVNNVNGGVIYNLGECVIVNSNFNNCITQGNGIIYSNGNLNVKNTNFITCVSKNGGAIFTTKDN